MRPLCVSHKLAHAIACPMRSRHLHNTNPTRPRERRDRVAWIAHHPKRRQRVALKRRWSCAFSTNSSDTIARPTRSRHPSFPPTSHAIARPTRSRHSKFGKYINSNRELCRREAALAPKAQHGSHDRVTDATASPHLKRIHANACPTRPRRLRRTAPT